MPKQGKFLEQTATNDCEEYAKRTDKSDHQLHIDDQTYDHNVPLLSLSRAKPIPFRYPSA